MNLADIQKRVLASSSKKYLLDEYPNAAAAYSLRKLRSGYTGNCIEVRRASDNTTQNIGFVNDVLDTASLLSFVGAGNGFVRTWYDQSGNGRDADQTVNASQPQIVSSGNLLVTNNKARIDFDGSNDFLSITSFNYNAQNFETFVGKRNATGRRLYALSRRIQPSGYAWALWSDNKYYYQGASGTGYQASSSTDLTTAQLILTGFRNTAGNMQMYKNGGLITSSFVSFNLQNGIDSIGQYGGSNYAFCELQEIVFYNSDQSTNRTGIESNINAYYNIY